MEMLNKLIELVGNIGLLIGGGLIWFWMAKISEDRKTNHSIFFLGLVILIISYNLVF